MNRSSEPSAVEEVHRALDRIERDRIAGQSATPSGITPYAQGRSNGTKPEDDASLVATQITDIILANRKVRGTPCDSWQTCPECRSVLYEKVRRQVVRGKPVTMVAPCFPFAMPNPRKKFGLPYPDKSEELAIKHLRDLCRRIEASYAPGAQFIVASDGHVLRPFWNNWFGVTEEDVNAYTVELRSVVAALGASGVVRLWGLEDAVADGKTFDEKRDLLERDYPVSLDETAELIRTPGNAQNEAYKGQKRYVCNDGFDSPHKGSVMARFGEPQATNSAVRRVSSRIAEQAIHMADAWGHRISKEFPDALRLSVHPYPAHFKAKLGIHLTQTREEWITPWHGVAVYHILKDEWELMHRYAVSPEAELIRKADRPYCYIVKD